MPATCATGLDATNDSRRQTGSNSDEGMTVSRESEVTTKNPGRVSGVLDRTLGLFFEFFQVSSDNEKLLLILSCAVAFGYLELLGAMHGAWLLDAQGHPLARDFAAFWSAGRQALAGAALATYDPNLQHAAEVATVGHAFGGGLGWSYPPVFLLAVAMLACLPYASAFVAWCVATIALYGGVVAAISERRIGFMIALAAPWVPMALSLGQNGFLTAAIIGLVLLNLENRPVVSGLILGLLSYKPQFGILFPFALAAGGYWRAFVSAAVAAAAWNGLAGAVFGFATLGAFLDALSLTAQTHLIAPGLGWKVQSLYGLVRTLGGSGTVAWTAQALIAFSTLVLVVVFWRTKMPFSIKAAFLAAAVTLPTPYIFFYDLPVLAVALAFVYRHRRFDKIEIALIAGAIPCVFASFWLVVPSAWLASLAVAAIALRRCYSSVQAHRSGESRVSAYACSVAHEIGRVPTQRLMGPPPVPTIQNTHRQAPS